MEIVHGIMLSQTPFGEPSLMETAIQADSMEFSARSGLEVKHGGRRLKPHFSRIGSDRPLISVITPVFNGAKTLESSILSVSSQSSAKVEYIIVDGASTDRTLEIIREHESFIDYWISEPDQGVYDAMNKGVQLASGRWLCFLGSDDTLCNSLETVAALLSDEWTVYYGNVFMTGTKRVYDGAFGPWKLSRRNICQQAIFYPRAVFETRQFDLRYRLLADWEFNIRSYSDARFKFQFIPVMIAHYNDLSGKSSVGVDPQFRKDHARILRECFPAQCYVWYQLKATVRAMLASIRGSKS
jgi:hypothetical protein